MSAVPVPAFETWIATRVGPAPPVRFPGLQAALDWLGAGLPDRTKIAALHEAARDCLTRFAHQADLPITVERWPLSRERRFSVALVSHNRGASESLEIRLSPEIRIADGPPATATRTPLAQR